MGPLPQQSNFGDPRILDFLFGRGALRGLQGLRPRVRRQDLHVRQDNAVLRGGEGLRVSRFAGALRCRDFQRLAEHHLSPAQLPGGNRPRGLREADTREAGKWRTNVRRQGDAHWQEPLLDHRLLVSDNRLRGQTPRPVDPSVVGHCRRDRRTHSWHFHAWNVRRMCQRGGRCYR